MAQVTIFTCSSSFIFKGTFGVIFKGRFFDLVLIPDISFDIFLTVAGVC